MTEIKRNVELLRDPAQNKSTAFTREEREAYGLRGLLPYIASDQETQINRIMGNLRRKEFDIERYIFLSALQDRNERLFYKTALKHIDEITPLIYTPTVGQACKEFSHIYRHAHGFYITPEDRGMMDKILDNWPEKDIRVIVVTDGQRILGLGDLGANGMGIPIGKLALYTTCAGIHPGQCLPVMLDVGTNNRELLDDPLYIGYPHERIKGDAYFQMVDEFVQTVQSKYPDVLIQFEDFQTANAFKLLEKYQDKVLCFNDDIQGTSAVALSGILNCERITGIPYKDLTIMFLGAGSAAIGIGDLMVNAFVEDGLPREEAMRRLWFVDRHGLVVAGRGNVEEHKQRFAHEHPHLQFMEALDKIRPNVLIGATGTSGSFPQEVIERMAKYHSRPVIFALSNPTDRAECTPEQAYHWSRGNAVYASGSPFKAFQYGGRLIRPGQGNNVYIFPGVGLAAVITKAKMISDNIFLTAARALAACVTNEDINHGSVYPPFRDIRKISLEIATAVANKIFENGHAQVERPSNLRETIAAYMYDPSY
ncbi:MAG TPA: NAD-dependent malic enzyme [Saprospiraceae bacterium]|nr:NAD-dependent malic enzyme [Saprospiraceae bacterium]